MPSAEQAQSAIITILEYDLLRFGYDVGSSGDIALLCRGPFQHFWRPDNRFLRFQIKLQITGNNESKRQESRLQPLASIHPSIDDRRVVSLKHSIRSCSRVHLRKFWKSHEKGCLLFSLSCFFLVTLFAFHSVSFRDMTAQLKRALTTVSIGTICSNVRKHAKVAPLAQLAQLRTLLW